MKKVARTLKNHLKSLPNSKSPNRKFLNYQMKNLEFGIRVLYQTSEKLVTDLFMTVILTSHNKGGLA